MLSENKSWQSLSQNDLKIFPLIKYSARFVLSPPPTISNIYVSQKFVTKVAETRHVSG
jgi:hypothetical protein